jgi:uncharacterized protein
VHLYVGSSQQFIDDTFHNRIAEKLRQSFFQAFRYNPPMSEVNAWQNSLRAMSSVLQHAALTDQGILLEYQLPMSSKRLDCLITGRSDAGSRSAAVVELKQWQQTEPSALDDCVVTFVGGRLRDVLHPARQVGQYRNFLIDTHTAFNDEGIALAACAYLHNYQFDPMDELYSARHADLIREFPVFAGDQAADLAGYLSERVGQGEGLDVLGTVLESTYRPSRKLLEHTADMVAGQSQYILLDEQLVVFNAVLEQAQRGFRERGKAVILVHGGPGTGKSVIALHLVGVLSKLGFNAQHATGSRAFTGNIRKVVGTRAGVQFRYFNSYGDAESNAIDVLIMDEAHRIRKTSASQYTPKDKRSGLSQIEELLRTAKVAVFFIDDRQVVRPQEVGNSMLIREAAAEVSASLTEFDLETQFRCGGSEAFISWIENTLAINRTPTVLWDQSETFDFRIIDSIHELERLIRLRQSEGASARLAAGFCWQWSGPLPDGTLEPDVQVNGWEMPWNAKPDAGRLAQGIPKADFWASDPRGIEQVGCVYTAQGFEFDYIGIIWGRDLRFDLGAGQWIGDPTESADSPVKRSKGQFLDLVKNTYRVLLTRGLKGCYVYFLDDDTRNFVRSRTEQS